VHGPHATVGTVASPGRRSRPSQPVFQGAARDRQCLPRLAVPPFFQRI